MAKQIAPKPKADPKTASTAGVAVLDHPGDGVDPNAETVILPSPTSTPPSSQRSTQQIVIELPVGPEGGYVTRGFRRDLPMPQAQICKRVINQLQADGVKLSSGRAIESPDDVLCYVMEQVERGITLNL